MGAEYCGMPVKIVLVDADPDGTPCIVCGDAVYLSAKRVEIRNGVHVVGRSEGIVCGSCAEGARFEITGVEGPPGVERPGDATEGGEYGGEADGTPDTV